MMAAKDDRERALDAFDNNQNFTYKGKRYTPRQIISELLGENGIITRAIAAEEERTQAAGRATKQERNVAGKQNRQREVALARAQDELTSLNNQRNFYRTGLANGEVSEQEYSTYTGRIQQVTRDIEAMKAGSLAVPVGYREYSMLETGLSAPTPAAATDRPETQRFEQMYLGQPTPLRIGGAGGATPTTTSTVTTGGISGGGSAKPTKVTKSDVDDGLVTYGLTDTPENRTFVRNQLKQGKTISKNWETLVEQQAGEYAYLLQGQFGQDVADLLRRAVSQEWFKSDEGKKEFVDQFRRTEYYKTTTQKQQLFDKKTSGDKTAAIQAEVDRIRSNYGEIQFDEMALNELAQTAARNGSSDTELGRLVYRKAFQRGQVAPAAAETAIRSADADRVRAIYRAYGQRANDDEIRRILAQEADPATGTVMTEDMLRNQLRDTAKVTFGQFADMIDRGISVEKIFSPYQQVAAGVLERTPDEISLVGENGVPTMYSEALMGEKPMSLTEWVRKLKVDPKYGYQFTNEAKQQVTNLVVDLEKAFGYRA